MQITKVSNYKFLLGLLLFAQVTRPITRESIAYIIAGGSALASMVTGIWAYNLSGHNQRVQIELESRVMLSSCRAFIKKALIDIKPKLKLSFLKNNFTLNQIREVLALIVKNLETAKKFEQNLKFCEEQLLRNKIDASYYIEAKTKVIARLKKLKDELAGLHAFCDFLQLRAHVFDLKNLYQQEIAGELTDTQKLHEKVLEIAKNAPKMYSSYTGIVENFPYICYVKLMQKNKNILEQLLAGIASKEDNIHKQAFASAQELIAILTSLLKNIESNPTYIQELEHKKVFDAQQRAIAQANQAKVRAQSELACIQAQQQLRQLRVSKPRRF